MIACRVHHTKTALMLLCFGADHTHRNEFLETAFDLAIAVDPERQEKKSLRLILIGSWAMSLALTLPMVLRHRQWNRCT